MIWDFVSFKMAFPNPKLYKCFPDCWVLWRFNMSKAGIFLGVGGALGIYDMRWEISLCLPSREAGYSQHRLLNKNLVVQTVTSELESQLENGSTRLWLWAFRDIT